MTLVSTARCRIVLTRWIPLRRVKSVHWCSEVTSVGICLARWPQSSRWPREVNTPMAALCITITLWIPTARSKMYVAMERGMVGRPARCPGWNLKVSRHLPRQSLRGPMSRVWNKCMEILTFKSALTRKCWKYGTTDQYRVLCNPPVQVTHFVSLCGVHSFRSSMSARKLISINRRSQMIRQNTETSDNHFINGYFYCRYVRQQIVIKTGK